MSKKDKPIKIAPGKYWYKCHTIRSYGTKPNMVWKAMDEDDNIVHTGATLHEIVGMIDERGMPWERKSE